MAILDRRHLVDNVQTNEKLKIAMENYLRLYMARPRYGSTASDGADVKKKSETHKAKERVSDRDKKQQ